MLKEKGKKLFLLTNSPYYFVDGGMRFMLEVFDCMESYPHFCMYHGMFSLAFTASVRV